MGKSIQLKDIENEKYYVHPYLPVGSIYLSVNNTNPTKWFDGTWELIAKGRTLVGVDESDTDFNTVKKTGGSKYLAQHHHYIAGSGTGSPGDLDSSHSLAYWASSSASDLPYSLRNAPDLAHKGKTSSVGTGNSGNLQPYFTCYIWCRTA